MGQRLIWVLWPGFVAAIPAVGLVFSIVDPADLQWFGAPLEVSRLGAYTLGLSPKRRSMLFNSSIWYGLVK